MHLLHKSFLPGGRGGGGCAAGLGVLSLLFWWNVTVLHPLSSCGFLIPSGLLWLLLQSENHFLNSVREISRKLWGLLTSVAGGCCILAAEVCAVIRTTAMLATKAFPGDHQVALIRK